MDKKQIAIVGAGIAGLLACKYCLSKGFNPIVFEFESDIGGVWAKTIKTTRLQIPKTMYQFSDYPWPASVTDDFPTQQEMIDYIRSYATHFNLIPHIKLQSRVKGIDYDGPSSNTWSLWNGTGEAFPPEGKWNVTVENAQTATTQVCMHGFYVTFLPANSHTLSASIRGILFFIRLGTIRLLHIINICSGILCIYSIDISTENI
ncbi:putative flavin-containing monooxygenase [Helianthus annuus]|uniref:Flavin-containing monooxygenase n=1 Tax=Helianthus annuus TaxID=4232 RepID=A0A251RQ87_HELAN|nr:putative flavin-containing monooxygenase [Helianthus annuus]KAJ0428699.1 putative flavin-containing monooxygenase [Helianthus annuus]KAJ0808083.1 putative flavin-containing monooxygenase [Helianthus annuus]